MRSIRSFPPEGCASILWRSSEHGPEAAEALKLTAADLLGLGVIDRVIGEPLGGAHRNPGAAITALGEAIEDAFRDLEGMDGGALRRTRRERFLALGREM